MDTSTIVSIVLLLAVIYLIYIQLNKKPKSEEANAELELNALKAQFNLQESRLKELETEKHKIESERNQLLAENSTLHERLRGLNEKLLEQKKDLSEIQEKFQTEFKLLASQILEKNSEKFGKEQKEKLEHLLNPLKDDLNNFRTKIESNHAKSLEWNASLKTIISDLSEKNKALSEDAKSLASALKGESKTQGNWGELVLERVLEMAGLVKGIEYDLEVSTTNATGNTIRPDAVVYLPDNKHIIIDSKVSLTAYLAFSEAEDKEESQRHLKNHIISIKNHIESLAAKAYSSGKAFDAPELVLMFVPVERGFELAMHEDQQLYDFAYKRNVVIVSAATLLATLKTVASIWKQEKQNRNVQAIAEEATKMYDKFVGFAETMVKIGKALERANVEYDHGLSQLKSGKGNLIGRAAKIKQLGAKGNKELPSELIEKGDSDDE